MNGGPENAGGPGRLAGRNIFELRAVPQANAAGTATEAPPAPPANGHKTTPQQQAAAPQEAYVSLPTSDESETLLRIRHSSAHMMAMAVQKLYKDAQVTIGPWIDRGFYYDFDIKQPLTDKELKQIKKEMQKIAKAKLPFIREDVSKEEAERRIKEINEPYKLEILESILSRNPDADITIYHIGEKDHPMHWWDLCAGPHVEKTSDINMDAVKLESVAGAYWRGDENRAMLQRIYGTAWETPQQLEAYIKLKEEAARRDHRKLGQELDLFSLQETAGLCKLSLLQESPSLGEENPNVCLIRHLCNVYCAKMYGVCTAVVRLPAPKLEIGHIGSPSPPALWLVVPGVSNRAPCKTSPCLPKVEDLSLSACFFLLQVCCRFSRRARYERSGTMHGLFRARGFTQDDGHIFCLPSQISSEIVGVLELMEQVLSTFGFSKYEVNLSTRPEKSVGDDNFWDIAESSLVEALNRKGWSYQVDEGGGAFYGPKIDLKIQDAIGRKWQCSTVQLDFNLPQRFDMTYIDEENTKQRPIMIHRAIFGSIERFFGILIENYAGAFPIWLAPTQVRLLTITDDVAPYAHEVAASMKKQGIRAKVEGGASISKLVRNATTAKTPVICIIGRQASSGSHLQCGGLNARVDEVQMLRSHQHT
ncbi:ADP,ATP carrier protein [Dunaliella salina]|uniref:threonine--tRNA ligase n=1 Tax=Dunaliella salina TaxID=3046 RepID=A0ABQ7G0Z8_DUNSA|nr:ADP,ATP carrier protein [Dunaliella salina]|eukprot:KAF5828273.1 ADP,ATP carrier protein [Dunaliella salina]